jgi:hypothetical protein
MDRDDIFGIVDFPLPSCGLNGTVAARCFALKDGTFRTVDTGRVFDPNTGVQDVGDPVALPEILIDFHWNRTLRRKAA